MNPPLRGTICGKPLVARCPCEEPSVARTALKAKEKLGQIQESRCDAMQSEGQGTDCTACALTFHTFLLQASALIGAYIPADTIHERPAPHKGGTKPVGRNINIDKEQEGTQRKRSALCGYTTTGATLANFGWWVIFASPLGAAPAPRCHTGTSPRIFSPCLHHVCGQTASATFRTNDTR
jgi:hypothetical protein